MTQGLQADLSERERLMKQIEDDVASLTVQASVGDLDELTELLTQLRAKWTAFQKQAAEKCGKMLLVVQNYTSFTSTHRIYIEEDNEHFACLCNRSFISTVIIVKIIFNSCLKCHGVHLLCGGIIHCGNLVSLEIFVLD